MVLTLRSGGEVTCDQKLVEKIVADEVPHPDPVPAASAQDQGRSALVRGAQLKVTPYADMISAAAQAHGVDPILVQALIQVESNYKPRARSSKGAMGLMQLMPATAEQYGADPLVPEQNIDAGTQYLGALIHKYGKYRNGLKRAIAAYNAGPGMVDHYRGIPPYRETRVYVTRVLSYMKQFERGRG